MTLPKPTKAEAALFNGNYTDWYVMRYCLRRLYSILNS